MNQSNYESFLQTKKIVASSVGFEYASDCINPMLYDFQRDLTLWALKRGEAGEGKK